MCMCVCVHDIIFVKLVDKLMLEYAVNLHVTRSHCRCGVVLGGTTVLPWNRGSFFSRYRYRQGHGTNYGSTAISQIPRYYRTVLPCNNLVICTKIFVWKASLLQSCYQGLSWQGQDFFLKAKDIKFFQGQYQGQLSQLPLWAKICITLTDTEYAYLIIHNAKETICDSVDVRYLRPEVPRPRPRSCHPRLRPRPRGSSRPRPGLEDNETGLLNRWDHYLKRIVPNRVNKLAKCSN